MSIMPSVILQPFVIYLWKNSNILTSINKSNTLTDKGKTTLYLLLLQAFDNPVLSSYPIQLCHKADDLLKLLAS